MNPTGIAHATCSVLIWAAEDGPARRGLSGWLADPRSAVLATLAAVVGVGGVRKLLQARRATAAVEALNDPEVSPEVIESASRHGRAGIIDLFRILGSAKSADRRDAAGRALAVLWKQDEMIVEEEQALVRRGFVATWRARRRYPRGIVSPIPFSISFGVPFLTEAGDGISPENLEWSVSLLGSERASLEVPTPWVGGPGRFEFTLDPTDFDLDGPHRLALRARVRSVGLTDAWEIELPHVPFSFEFDRLLDVNALLATPDSGREEALNRILGFEAVESDASSYLSLNEDWALRNPLALVIRSPLPSDLAASCSVEIEGVDKLLRAAPIVLASLATEQSSAASPTKIRISGMSSLPADAIDRPGTRRFRLILTPDPDRGWADPDIRSIGPGTIATPWCEARVIRR